MNFDLKERIMLRNQYLILSGLDSHEKEHYERVIEILEGGFEAHYNELTCKFSPVFDQHASSFVIDVLDMYTTFEWAKAEGVTVPSEKSNLFNFHGFHGDEELSYRTYAKFQIDEDGRWNELKGKDCNSPIPTLSRYTKMLAAWKQSADTHKLTNADFVRIAHGLEAK